MIFKNLTDLIKQANRYRYADIADNEKQIKEKKPKMLFTTIQWIIIFSSVLLNILLNISSNNGFSSEFCGYSISGLSLFVGIFFTFIIALYEKFIDRDFSKYYYSNNKENYKFGIRLINYYKKTTVLSLYLILLSIVCIILLSAILLFSSTLNQNLEPILFIITNICHTLVLCFLLDAVFLTLELTSSIFDFMISNYNDKRKDLEKDYQDYLRNK